MKSPAKFWCAAIVGVALLLVLAGWALHLHAKSSLARVKARLVAAGEKLSVEENLPALVPDEENGAKEFLDAVSMLSNYDAKVQLSVMSILTPGRARCISMETNAPTVEVADVWPGLREHLHANRPALLKLREAMERPRLQFKVSYGSGFNGLAVNHLSRLKSAAQRLSASVMMNLRDGRSEEARQDLRALVAIPARTGNEPLMISELVRVAIAAIAAAATWETLQHSGWTEAQLAEMQGWWEAIPVTGVAARALAMERAMLGGEYDQCRADATYLSNLQMGFGIGAGGGTLDVIGEIGNAAIEDPGKGLQMFMTMFPRRWAWKPWNSYHDEAWALGILENYIRAARDWDAGRPYVEIEQSLQQSISANGETPPQYLLAAVGFLGAQEKFVQKLVFAETQRRMVITAIALRRYQLAHGSQPAKVEELVPRFLPAMPLDPMDGKPLRYRRTGEGAPLLYSVGTNGMDDNADPRPLATGIGKYWMHGRDILWPQRATPEELSEHLRELESKRPPGRRSGGSR